jgi:hypothetical protein
MQAIMRTKEHAMDRYPANAKGWGTAIQLLHELATEKDVERLNTYCENNKYNKYLGDDDSEIYESWSRAFQGEHLYYLIRYGISGREDWEPEVGEPYYYGFGREEDNTGYEYYLAYHHWNAFQGWLANHSEACESFNQFKVSAMINCNPSLFLL